MEFIPERRGGTVRWYLLGTLIALELLMSFSFLGYFHVEPISVTIAYIPVLLAGALMGPADASILGAVFGLASMWKASASYVMATDQLFSPFLSGRPLESFLLSVGARTLFGFLIGLLYWGGRRLRWQGGCVFLISYLGPTLHAALVYAAMAAFFPETGYGPVRALDDLTHPADIAANLLIALAVYLLWRVQRSRLWQQFQARVELARSFHLQERYHTLSLAITILITLCSSVAVALYFVHRIDYVLEQLGISLSDVGYGDILHLQIQFLIGIVSLMVLVIVFLIFNRRYATYMNHEAKMDPLTGVMNRKVFFQTCRSALARLSPQEGLAGYFIMVDLDWFKEINDRYGHPEGDRALRTAARALQEIFGYDALVGRMGGDEFAVLMCTPISREELEVNLHHFLDRMHKITWEDSHASCSVGALPIPAGECAPEALYRDADRLLYLAKERGRDQFVIGAPGQEAAQSSAHSG